MLGVGLHLVRGAAILALLFPLMSAARRRAAIAQWSSTFLAILAVRLDVAGAPPQSDGRPVMVVANHVSWVDILAINAILPVRFVAKAEVRKWPFIGWMCKRAGTLFIERAYRRDTVRLNELLVETMRGGDAIAIFPEATTTDGSGLLQFHSSLMQPAVVTGAAVWPVAIRFQRMDGTLCWEAAYTGGTSVWDTLKLMATQREIRAQLFFLQPIDTCDAHRRVVAVRARQAILRALFPPAPNNRTG